MTQTVLLGDVVAINPTTILKKPSVCTFVSMDKLSTFKRKIEGRETREYSGGSKFINGDTLLARITPCLENGKTAYVDILEKDEVGVGSTEFIVLRAKDGVTDSDYIYYLSISSEFRKYAIQAMIGTSGRQRIQNDVLAKYEFELPTIEKQREIGQQLRDFDEKIELNRQMNETLEQMGQALFRHYFVDNVEAEGWNISTIGKECDVVLGGTPSRAKPEYWENGTVGWINSGKVNEFRIIEPSELITDVALKNSAAKIMPSGTTVLAITGATLGQVSRLEKPFAANQSVIGILGNKKVSNEFMYYWINENIKKIIGQQTGGAQQHINRNNIVEYELLMPPSEIVQEFQGKILPIMNGITIKNSEIQTLTTLRDTLLPQLISGKIKL